jgi:hypothetical protein
MRGCGAVQKWSDHAPVVLDLRDMPEHDSDKLPPPCSLSSRGTPKNSLKAMFQQGTKPKSVGTVSACASQVGSCLEGVRGYPWDTLQRRF